MLVLSRKRGEWVDIDGGSEAGGVSICVTGIGPDKVRIGIEARRDVPVHRREVAKRIQMANDNQGAQP